MDFHALKDYLEKLPEMWSVPGCALIVRVGGETVFEEYVRSEKKDIYWLYSATKVFTAVMFGRLVERGALKLDDRVSDYLPEYARLEIADAEGGRRTAAKAVTLRQLAAMCGGLTYNIFDPLIREAKDKTTRGIVREIAGMPLIAEPGEAFNYSLCHDVLAAVMETVTGVRYADLIRREIAEPLGMSDACFHPSEEQRSRFAAQFTWNGAEKKAVPADGGNMFCFSEAYDSGGAGLCCRAADYILLPQALAGGGLGRDGYPLLKPETIDLLRKNQLNEAQRAIFTARWPNNRSYGYGLGVRTRLDASDGSLAPMGEFGWDGAAGAYCLADPKNRLSAFYVQHVLNMGPVFEVIHPALRDRIYQGLQG